MPLHANLPPPVTQFGDVFVSRTIKTYNEGVANRTRHCYCDSHEQKRFYGLLHHVCDVTKDFRILIPKLSSEKL